MLMRTCSAFRLLLAVGILATQPPSSAAQDNDALKLVRTAADVATNVRSGSIDGYTAIYVAPVTWMEAMTDSDLGPFLATQEATSSRSAACLFSPAKNNVVCVYFDGAQAYGFTALKSDRKNPFTSGAAAASYKPITRELLQKAPGKIAFSPINITLDNGQTLEAYLVKLSAK
jgi:hypothetical protein